MNVGLLFPGEMGAELGAAVRGRVLWASEGRSPATARRAAAFEDVGTLAELIARSEIILSVCPPVLAEEVAREVASLGFRGLYVEANAISPERMTRIATGRDRVVDGAVIGRSGTHLYLSGDPVDVGEVAALFAGSHVEAIPLEGGVGSASALKLAFAGWNKISSALVAQAHAIARGYGVGAALEAEGVSAERLGRVAARAWRWAPEMDEVGDLCRAVGLPDGMAGGAAELFGRWCEHRDDEEVELPLLLDQLRTRRASEPPPSRAVPETAEELYARAAGNLRMPPVKEWDTFPFEGELHPRPLLPPVEREAPRHGEGGGAGCRRCAAADDAYLWTNERWRLNGLERPTGLPVIVLLEPRDHFAEPGDLPDELAAELGILLARVERAIRGLGEIGRVHVCRWGDGSEHLHWWFLARPARLPQLIGSFAAIWDDVLPPLPEEVWRANLNAVARNLAGSD